MPDGSAGKKWGRWAGILCLAPVFAWIAIYSYPYFFESLTHTGREIKSYNLDSGVMLDAVEAAMAAPWHQMSFIEYGHFYFNISMAAAELYRHVAPLTERALFFILRLFSLLGSLATIAVTFAFARRYLGVLEALFAAAVLGFSPRFIEFAEEVKPDSWQVFFIMLSLYCLARAFEPPPTAARRWPKAQFAWVAAASAAAGAAFATKYQGVLLGPLLLIAAVAVPASQVGDRFFARATRIFLLLSPALGLALLWFAHAAYPGRVIAFLQSAEGASSVTATQYLSIEAVRLVALLVGLLCLAAAAAFVAGFDLPRSKLLSRILILLSIGLAFAGAFAIASPWLLYHFQFLPNLYTRSSVAGAGAWYGFHWLNMIFGIGALYPSIFFNHAIGLLVIVGAVLLLAALGRRDFTGNHLPFLMALGFAIIFIGLLITKINFVTSLYPLQAVPALILVAAFGLYAVRRTLARRLDRNTTQWASGLLGLLLIISQVWQGGAQLLQYPMLVTSLTPANRALGDWLDHCAATDAHILAAGYAYVPPRFQNVTVGFGGATAYFQHADPGITIIDLNDAAALAKSRKAAPAASASSDYYDAVMRSPQWRAGPIFAPYRVYVKSGATTDCR